MLISIIVKAEQKLLHEFLNLTVVCAGKTAAEHKSLLFVVLFLSAFAATALFFVRNNKTPLMIIKRKLQRFTFHLNLNCGIFIFI